MFHFRIGGGDMMMHWRCVSLIFLVSSTLLHAKKIVRMGTQSFLASCVFYCGQHLICSNGSETHHRVTEVRANLQRTENDEKTTKKKSKKSSNLLRLASSPPVKLATKSFANVAVAASTTILSCNCIEITI